MDGTGRRKHRSPHLPSPLPLPQRIRRAVSEMADFRAPVLITGETGTGKSTLAREIHRASRRARGPFVTVDCGALVGSLARGELYGNVPGAWTDARGARHGLIRGADGGTLFLDEIGVLSAEDQTALLHVLDQGEVRPLGGDRYVFVDVRVIAATNEDLRSLIDQGRFRRDLFYRCASLSIDLPPLRSRTGELPEIVRYVLDDLVRSEFGSQAPLPDIPPITYTYLAHYSFPGNLRELRSILLRALARDRHRLDVAADLEDNVPGSGKDDAAVHLRPTANDPPKLRYRGRPSQEERANIIRALSITGSVRQAALSLGMSRSLLYRRIELFEITREEWKGA